MRLYGITEEEVELTIADPVRSEADSDGNPRLTAVIGDRVVVVVIALDAPNLVIATWKD